ncbi:Innexin unc-7 [Lamellibrachia satsuma]|nr:Innexin unc-7 [Lamellibrachia satsuma]
MAKLSHFTQDNPYDLVATRFKSDDIEILFECLIVATKSTDDTETMFRFELYIHPRALFGYSLMLRKYVGLFVEVVLSRLTPDTAGPTDDIGYVSEDGALLNPMERFVGMFSHAGETKIRSDDDVVDRLNHRYSTFILVVFAVVVSTKQYVGEPINCWCPAQFTDNHEDFTNKICWVSNTYYVPPSQRHLPGALEPKERIGYYQWVPMILLTQAVFFYMPCMLWRFLNNKAGIDVNSVIEEAVKLNDTAWCERRGKTLRFTAQQMSRYLSGTREFRRGRCTRCKHFVSRHFCLVCGRRYGNYLVTLYIFIKLLYLANIAAQLFALEAFLGSDYHIYGVQLVVRLLRQQDWAASERFPRVTLCDFYVRQLGNIHRHTVQCVLPINLFNEKIFIFVWFWLVFMASMVVCSTLAWLYR